jgi:RimJ/RimL family protein N-acetyltransferase
MIYPEKLEGHFINLRSVLETDAEFILKLRLNKTLNKYLNKVDNDLEKQKLWIKEQQKGVNDFYFIIERKSGLPIGTISLYNIKELEGEFGRWISIGNPVENLESVLLLHDFGFYKMNLDLIYSETVKENEKVLNFHKRFGAKLLNEFREYNEFIVQKAIIKKESYKIIRENNLKIIDYYSKKSSITKK